MPFFSAKHDHKRHLKKEKERKNLKDADFHYPLEKPIVDIYREINEQLWKEKFEDIIS